MEGYIMRTIYQAILLRNMCKTSCKTKQKEETNWEISHIRTKTL